jgi:hypothetical protein
MLVSVRPSIRELYLARGLSIGKRVEYMGQLLSRDIMRLEVAIINALMTLVALI